MPRAGIPQPFRNNLDEFREQEKVILEKGIRRHFPAFRRYPQHHLYPALWRRISSYLLNLFAQRRLRNFAMLDVDHQAVIVANEADVQPLLELVPLAADHD